MGAEDYTPARPGTTPRTGGAAAQLTAGATARGEPCRQDADVRTCNSLWRSRNRQAGHRCRRRSRSGCRCSRSAG